MFSFIKNAGSISFFFWTNATTNPVHKRIPLHLQIFAFVIFLCTFLCRCWNFFFATFFFFQVVSLLLACCLQDNFHVKQRALNNGFPRYSFGKRNMSRMKIGVKEKQQQQRQQKHQSYITKLNWVGQMQWHTINVIMSLSIELVLSEWMNECMNKWMNATVSKWMHELHYRRIIGGYACQHDEENT